MTAEADVMIARQREATAVEAWNRLYPVGTPVVAYPGFRPEVDRNARGIISSTRSKATVLGGHTAVVWVHGHGACIALTHVDVRISATDGEIAEYHHLLYDADADASTAAFPYPTTEATR
ncbi:hypothetical protein [Streptomyces sp. NPDC002547]